MIKKTLLLLLTIVAAVSASAADAPTIYGWLRFERNQDDYGVCRFTADAPDDITLLHVFDADKQACAGAAANGTYYVYRYAPNDGSAVPLDFGTVDLTTGAFTRIADYTRLNTLFADMTYDYATETMYAIGNPGGGNVTHLLKVDLTNGDITDAGSLQEKFSTLACGIDGTMYAVRSDGYLCMIDASSLTVTEIGDTYEVPEEYLQSMEFDHATETLYWAGSNTYDEDFLDSVDLTTGETFRIGYLGTTAQVVGLYIPFVRIHAKAPAAVTDLKAMADATGALSATLSWSNPTTTYGSKEDPALTAIKIYRGGELVATLDGTATTWTDATVSEGGMNTYTVVAVNAYGEGDTADVTVWVGYDIPVAPGNATAEKAGDNSLKVTWTAPAAGTHGGNIDIATLKYNIVRQPDGTQLYSDYTGTELTDELTARGCYSYEITAVTAQGSSAKATTNAVKAGPAYTVPYECNFSDDSKFGTWDVIDANNDGYTWRRETTLDAAYYYYNEDNVTAGDDWLISSPILLKAGKTYKLAFKLQSYDVDYPENMDVYLGRSNTVEAMTVKLGDYTVASNTFVEYELMLPEIAEDGEYYLGFHDHSDAYMFILYLTDVKLTEFSQGTISGRVTETDGATAVEGVTVKIDGTDISTTTGSDGSYTLSNVETGQYTLVFTADGYGELRQAIEVKAGETTTANVALTKLAKVAVSGKVVSDTGKAVAGAVVRLDAYTSESAVTDLNGEYTISEISTAGTAKLTVSHREMETYSAEVTLASPSTNLGSVTMTTRTIAPENVAVATDADAIVTWEKPAGYESYRLDSGVYDGRIGNVNGTKYSVYGNVMRTPARLRSISWYTDKYLQEHKTVNVFVFDLDTDGNPTSTILFKKEGVANTDNQWNKLTLDSAVDAPRGYMLAISVEGHAGLGLAATTDEYPFTASSTCYSDDYTQGDFTYVESHNIERHAMIRAEGVDLDKVDLPSALECTYKVWRLTSADVDNTSAWTLLTADAQSALTLTDTQWSSLKQGIYRYAVKAVYTGECESEAALSAEIYKNMTTDVTVTLSTDTPTNEAEGATVTLTGEAPDGSEAVYTATANASGKATVSGMWKGSYKVTTAKHGFVTVETTADLSTENAYTLAYTLNEYVVDPFALEVKKTDDEASRLFSWNKAEFLFDDFESHTAFAVNSPGSIGWTYIDDSDTETLPIDGVDYDNAGAKMAFQVFNPYETDPVLGVLNADIRPYSGKQFLASFAKADASVYNNDFIVSPELNFSQDFVLKFYAKSCNEDYGQEKMNAGYSTSGNAASDFTWLNGDSPVELPMGDWKEYRYSVPADAKYVAVNCVSDYLFVMMLDDLFVGVELPDGVDPEAIRDDVTYEVWLDGVKVAETTDPNYTFSNLLWGTHRAGVKAVYHSMTTPLVEKEFEVELTPSSVDAVMKAECSIYPNPTKGRINFRGACRRAEVVNAAGCVVARSTDGQAVDISACADGVYFVRIFNGSDTTVKKVILRK